MSAALPGPSVEPRAGDETARDAARASWRATWALGFVALASRCAVSVWAAARFPPAGDGVYYDVLARRIAVGQGYTWAWPDGAVTHVAHYPVGYPALVAIALRIFGGSAVVPLLVNAVVGALGVAALHRLLIVSAPRSAAFAGAGLLALHPALLPYTGAVMTEGVVASILVVAAAVADRSSRARRAWPWLALAGLVMGVATLIRPQCLLLSPLLGLVARPAAPRGEDADLSAWRRWARPLGRAAIVATIAVACCVPWTIRNCARMQRCALVSVNGGWNLLIGAQTDTGAWQPLDVPEACREVWSESAKDECFSREAWSQIARYPWAWVSRAPRKWAVTFDYFGAAPWYFHASNPAAFSAAEKWRLGALETVVHRLTLLGALLAAALWDGPRRSWRVAVAAVGAGFALSEHGSVAHVGLALALLLLGPAALMRGPIVLPWTACVVLATGVTHAVFFGAGRYGLVVIPEIVAVAASVPLRAARASGMFGRADVGQAIAGPGAARFAEQASEREESPSSEECDAG